MGNAILRGQTGGASPTVISQKKLTLLADVTIYSARTSVDFTGLNVGADTELLLVSDIVSNANGTNFWLFVNGNTTSTNYYRQELAALGTTISAGRANDSPFAYSTTSGDKIQANVKIKMTNNGYFVYQSNSSRVYGGSGIFIDDFNGTSTFTISAITQLTVTSSISNAIGVGSRFQLYSLNTGGEKTWVTS